MAQAVLECHSPDPTPQEYAMMAADVPLIQAYASSASRSNAVINVPVYFHIIRQSNQNIPSSAEQAINGLNSTFASAGLNFVQIGEVNYLDRKGFNNFLWRWNRFSYCKTALNVYIGASQNFTNQPGTIITDPTNVALNMTQVGYFAEFPINGYHLLSHEVGHSMGLLHTFGSTTPYVYPPLPNQIDHPTDGQLRRELSIRSYDASKGFQYPNCNDAGDFCCDTDADCAPNAFAFPVFKPTLNCLNSPSDCENGCIQCIPETGQYRDYNADAIVGEPLNIMSYHNCGSELTADQGDRVQWHYAQYWQNQYENTDVNVRDYVEFMNEATPLNQVTVQYRHPNLAAKFSNGFSNKDGKFQGILYDPLVRATVRKLGSGFEYVGQTNATDPTAPHYVDKYTREDWEQGVDACDVIKIRKHISGEKPLDNGWEMIAANVAMGVGGAPISTLDIHYLKGFISGVHPTFSQYLAPWRFVPEYIPADYESQFNVNPFNMNINGVQVLNAAYTEPTWEYTITDGFNGKSGYDGIHLGDVDTDNSGCMFRCSTGVDVPTHPIMLPGNTYALNFEVSGAANLQALQLGMHVDPKIAIKDVLAGDLDDFDPTNDIGVNTIGQDEVRVIWVPDAPVSVGNTSSNNNAPVLMTWHVEVSEPVLNLGSLISLQDSILKNMAIKDQGCGQYTSMTISVDDLSDSRNAMDGQVATDKMWCMPNPANSNMTIIIESTSSEAATLAVFDLNGKLVYSYETNLQKGANTVSLGEKIMNGLLPGLYNAVLTKANGSSSIRFVKQ